MHNVLRGGVSFGGYDAEIKLIDYFCFVALVLVGLGALLLRLLINAR